MRQEPSRLLWTSKVQHHAHKTPLLASVHHHHHHHHHHNHQQVYSASQFRSFARYIRDFPMFNCPPAGYTSAAEAVCGAVDVFAFKTVSINHIL
jgi:hypothetical protein